MSFNLGIQTVVNVSIYSVVLGKEKLSQNVCMCACVCVYVLINFTWPLFPSLVSDVFFFHVQSAKQLLPAVYSIRACLAIL